MGSPDMDAADLPAPSDLTARLARLQALILVEPERARPEIEAVLAEARAANAQAQEAQCLLQLARCDFFQGRYGSMLEWAQTALQLSRRLHLASVETRSLNILGLAYHRQGTLDQAMRFFLDGLRLAQQTLDNDASAMLLSNIAMIHSNLQEHESALRLNEQAMQIAQQVGSAPLTANLLTSVSRNHLDLGQHERVLELAPEAVAFTHAHGLSRMEGYARINLGNTLLHLGRFEASLRVTHVGLRVARWAKDSEMVAQLCTIEGRALTALREYRQAGVRLREALDLSVEAANIEQEARTRQALVQWQEAQGDTEAAAAEQTQWQAAQDKLLDAAAMQRTQAAVAEFRAELGSLPHPLPLAWTAELTELTRSLKRANMELAHRAAHDPLTGALNRAHFHMRLQKQLDALGPNEMLGVVVLSLDDLRRLNDQHGQAMGDAVLAEISRRLQHTLRPGDLVGRLDNDQFIVLLDYLARESDLELVMLKMLDGLRQSLHIRDETFSLKASLGGVLTPRDGQSLDEILKNAQLAVQQVKQSGGNGVQVYQPQLSESERQRRALLYDLRTADMQEFLVHYQPQFDLPGCELAGAEALVRWQHPRLGLLGPGQFIPLAEETRAILDIGDEVLRSACQQASTWAFPQRGLTMAVNVSAVQFSQLNFVLSVRSALQNASLPGETLVLELTESMVQSNESLARAHLDALKALGVQVALDDFGTGFSSLSMLQNLPFQVLKIDRSFLNGLEAPPPESDRARLLIEVTVNLARNLHMEVVAEGVETQNQLELISALKCHQAQGYLLGRPAEAQHITTLLGEVVPKAPRTTLGDKLN